MPRLAFLISVTCLLTAIDPLRAADGLAVFPSAITLDSSDDQQQLVFTEISSGKNIDRTTDATFESNLSSIANVGTTGVVTAVGDGEAIITVTWNGLTAKVSVLVKNTKSPQPVTFERDVQPILTRAGCNAGACHGK